MVGDDASELRSMLEVNYPMENGIVRNWDDMIHLWDYTFGEEKLNVDPKLVVHIYHLSNVSYYHLFSIVHVVAAHRYQHFLFQFTHRFFIFIL